MTVAYQIPVDLVPSAVLKRIASAPGPARVVRRTNDPLTFGTEDVVHTHRNVTFGIKIVDSDWSFAYVFVKDTGGAWKADGLTESQLDLDITVNLKKAGSAKAYVQQFLVPALNKWLAVKFPPLSSPQAPLSPLEEVDSIMRGIIRFTSAADGTLKATAVE